MRRGNKFLGVIIFISIIVTMQFAIPCQGDTTVELTYKITKSRLIAEVDDEKIKTNKFNFDWHYFPEGTKIDVLMTYDETGMSADFTLSNLTKDFVYWTGALKIILFKHLVHTYYISWQLAMYWENFLGWNDGYSLYLYPYITPGTTTWDYFSAIGETYRLFYDQLATQGYDVACDYTISTTAETFSFEFWSGGNFTGLYKDVVIDSILNEPLTVSYDNLFKIIINKQTGFIEGFRIKGRTNGILLDNSNFDVMLDYQYVKVGRHMSDFTLGPNFLVDPYLGRKIGVGSGIGVITVTVIIYVSIKRRRKKRLERVQS